MIWQDAETQFRNIIAIAGESNEYVMELWDGTIARSLRMPSGPRWVRDLAKQMVPVETNAGIRHAVYPERDPLFMLVMRKIVRGLCSYHELGTAFAERRVTVMVQRYEVPEQFRCDFTDVNLGMDFCRYSFIDMRATDDTFHSFWVIEFFGRTRFFGMVSAAEEGWPDLSGVDGGGAKGEDG